MLPRLREPMTRRESREDKRRQTDEAVEGIVDEKWGEFATELNNFKTQFNDMNSRLTKVEETIKNLGEQKKTEIGSIDEKIESSKQSMGEMSSRMGAMENALKDTMTPMMQTMRSLSNTVKSLKDDSPEDELVDNEDSDEESKDLLIQEKKELKINSSRCSATIQPVR